MKIKKYKLREAIFKRVFILYDWLNQVMEVIKSINVFTFSLATLLFLCLLVYDLGFERNPNNAKIIYNSYAILLSILFVSKFIIGVFQISTKRYWFFVVNCIVLLFGLLVISVNSGFWNGQIVVSFFFNKGALIIASLGIIISETYRLSGLLDQINISPSSLFALSFLFIILLGSGLLMMPNSTTSSITYLEALFTSTSAVCVTGLVVVDTATVFTPIGKGIIMVLIQIGGLGIMAFTGFFSYIFLGSASIKDRLLLKDIFSGDQIGGMFKMLSKIIFITLLFESIGAILIYSSLQGQWDYKVAASVFHSISAFCNAGFSLIPQGLANPVVQFNYTLQITICVLVIFGGLGFPVLLTFYNYVKHKTKVHFSKMLGGKTELRLFPYIVGQKIAFQATVSLLVLGGVLYYLFEDNNSLANFSVFNKAVVSFFGSVSARTAGFNMVDITTWSYPTIFIIIFLMWVGASPGSTGGGIKTTTFAIALRAALSFCKGRPFFEVGNREIGMPTLIRVLSIIIVSILIISISFLFLMVFEPAKNPVYLLFECVSAFSTVGLSLVNTATLCTNSKIVIILLMFIGRIGPVVLLSGLLLSKSRKAYRLPVENIIIN